MLVIGVDCAVQHNKTGMVLATRNGALRLEEAVLGSKREPPFKIISTWVGRDENVLLALDAPLGWPKALGAALIAHSAGQFLAEAPHRLFRRATDDWIKARLGKRPLDVGADRIARTAHAALRLLDEVRQTTNSSVSLLWKPGSFSGVGAIEVYPAATRIALGVKDSTSVEPLSKQMEGDLSKLGGNLHLQDAAWCAVAGADFLSGLVEAPPDMGTATREGWIWARRLGT